MTGIDIVYGENPQTSGRKMPTRRGVDFFVVPWQNGRKNWLTSKLYFGRIVKIIKKYI